MRKVTKFITMWVLIMVFVGTTIPTYAANTQSTGYTVTENTDGELQISHDAYIPSGLFLDLGLEKAEDLYIINNKMYIADTGNKRALVVDLTTSKMKVIGEGLLNQPRGITADPEGNIYVTDYKNREAYRFDSDGKLEQVFVKPTTPNYGKNAEFNPTKIIPADDKGVYIVSEGTTAGMVHMNKDGFFLGYFGANDVQMSPFERMLKLILNEKQMEKYLNKTPPSFANIFRGYDGLIYSIIKGSGVSVTKHNLGGANMLARKRPPKINEPKDIAVTADGKIYVIDLNGYITEMTRDGYLLCKFAGPANGEDKVGLFYIPSAIGTDEEGNVYALDQEKNYVQVFTPTPNQQQLHKAVNLYNAGDYDGSMAILKEVVNFNNTSALAHTYLGKNYLQKGNYDKAAEHFKIANSKQDYSQAYWEIRNIWLQENVFIIFILLFAFSAFYLLYKHVKKRKGTQNRSVVKTFVKQLREKSHIANDLFGMKYAAFHPMDNAYEVKTGHIGSYLSATIIYMVFFVLLTIFSVGSGYIYSVRIQDFSIVTVFLYFAACIILFVIGNYFISSIKDGNATIRLIYITGAYSLTPAIFILPFVIAYSNFATIDDYFLRSTALAICVAWCVVSEILALIEIHQYTFKETTWNIALTLFFMVVTVIVLSLGYLLLKQIIDLFMELYMEVAMRV